ncbi:PIG-L family deacetylase [Candidatus Aerophobetes bacterium]|nr:PIG-L family deacetylase [Candidatus Aerophobetes bacterium]
MKRLTVLAVGAHPDDIEIGCAGTLARYVQEGHKVYISIVCRGNAGTKHLSAGEIVKIRADEAKKAAQIIGAELIMLGFGDGEVFHNKEYLTVFIDLVRKTRPDVIITHPPEEENFHNDHFITRQLIIDASIWATHKNLDMKTKYPPTEVIPSLFFFDQYVSGFAKRPTHYVDITSTMDIKKRALLEHKSQMEFLKELFKMDFSEYVELIARLRGLQCGVQYAEAFCQLSEYPRIRPYRILP